jgi:hypothetical protein
LLERSGRTALILAQHEHKDEVVAILNPANQQAPSEEVDTAPTHHQQNNSVPDKDKEKAKSTDKTLD